MDFPYYSEENFCAEKEMIDAINLQAELREKCKLKQNFCLVRRRSRLKFANFSRKKTLLLHRVMMRIIKEFSSGGSRGRGRQIKCVIGVKARNHKSLKVVFIRFRGSRFPRSTVCLTKLFLHAAHVVYVGS